MDNKLSFNHQGEDILQYLGPIEWFVSQGIAYELDGVEAKDPSDGDSISDQLVVSWTNKDETILIELNYGISFHEDHREEVELALKTLNLI